MKEHPVQFPVSIGLLNYSFIFYPMNLRNIEDHNIFFQSFVQTAAPLLQNLYARLTTHVSFIMEKIFARLDSICTNCTYTDIVLPLYGYQWVKHGNSKFQSVAKQKDLATREYKMFIKVNKKVNHKPRIGKQDMGRRDVNGNSNQMKKK